MRPTEDQELLLRAALLPGAAGVRAWETIRPRLDLDRPDPATARLLPLVYRAMRRIAPHDSLLPRLRESYVITWTRNQMLFRHAASLLVALAGAGIPSLLLKGAALVRVGYGNDAGARPMDDFDVAVPFPRAVEAVEVLRGAGWSPAFPVTPAFMRVKHAVAFGDRGGRACDLHWHVFEEGCRPDDDVDLWAASREIEFHGVPTRVLSPADQLLHVCAHGFKWSPMPGIRWIADATLILAGGSVDWRRLVEQARRRRYVIRMREMLGFLRERMSAPVPDEVLGDLGGLAVDRLERFETRVVVRPHRVLGQLLLYWCHHRRARDGGPLGAALTLPGFLQDAWGLRSLRQVPAGALARARRRVGGAFR